MKVNLHQIPFWSCQMFLLPVRATTMALICLIRRYLYKPVWRHRAEGKKGYLYGLLSSNQLCFNKWPGLLEGINGFKEPNFVKENSNCIFFVGTFGVLHLGPEEYYIYISPMVLLFRKHQLQNLLTIWTLCLIHLYREHLSTICNNS
jgi:hypothetical protein